MKVKDLVDSLGLVIYSGKEGLQREVTGGYASDLLSDVMGHAKEGQIWVTLQTHKNVMAIASLKDLAAVILVKNNQPDADTLEQSNEEDVPVLGTSKPAFEISGELYQILKKNEIL
jgi:serine kinase of HPr protein (carbohydrate metabolism regulator)